jgi:hypothetical protein
MRRAWWVWLLVGPVLVFNLRLHRVPGDPDLSRQLVFLRGALDRGEAQAMQRLFPEGYFFSHLLVALTELERVQDPADPRATLALSAAARAHQALTSPQGTGIFSPELTPPYGIFYQGWLAWLEVEQLRLGGTSSAAVDRRLDAIALAFSDQGPFLEAYPGQSWPCDNVVALAALSARDRLLPPRYAEVRRAWIAALRAEGELLPHQARPAVSPPRGSSQSLIQRFLPVIDAEWAAQAYPAFRRRLVTTRLGLPGVVEHEGGGGLGDVDSGPLLLGVSMSATVVGLAAARAHGDRPLAQALAGTMEAFGWPIGFSEKRYALGLVPVGDAFVAWAYGTPEAPPQEVQDNLHFTTAPIHGLSTLLLLLIPLAWSWRRRTPPEVTPAQL